MSRPVFLIVLLIVTLTAVGIYRFLHLGMDPRTPATATISTIDLLAEVVGDADFASADRPRAFIFPRDHVLHKDFRTEWWYFTGHLTDTKERPYGFQLTLFRYELDSEQLDSPSAWRTPRMFLGHFAVTDVANDRFHQFERMSRAFPDIAGTSTKPPAVWLDDWRVQIADGPDVWTLHARQSDIAIELSLTALTPVVAQGEGGLSQKSAARGNASYYYSIPHLRAEGTLVLPSGGRTVVGAAWLDHEWSTSALDREQVGWDWFALQFKDSSSLMFYRLRRRDGTRDTHSSGNYISASGDIRALNADDVHITVQSTWTSNATGTTYPSAWKLEVEELGLSVSILPRVAAQEWRGRFRYWEGAATFRGRRGAAPVDGLAYVELTGY